VRSVCGASTRSSLSVLLDATRTNQRINASTLYWQKHFVVGVMYEDSWQTQQKDTQ
jgi:hypothetical protein